MIRLANAAIDRPKTALAVCVVLAAVLVAMGLGLTDRLSPTMTFEPGTEAARAKDLAADQFGPSTLVPILLEGPRRQLDAQGPRLVRALARRPDTRVLSAWDAGEAGTVLRPSPRAAMIVASVARSEQALLDGVQAEIDATVDRVVSPPVRSHVSGQAVLDEAVSDEALTTARQATLLALPLLLLALLLVLRAPLAALVGTIFGGGVAFAAAGALTPIAEPFSVDAIGVALTLVMGLALGSAFALFVLTRFRSALDEATGGSDAAARAATATVAGTGRAVLVAGTGLFVALLVASLVGPSDNLRAIGAGVFVATLLAAGAAVVTLPALLTLLGRTTFAWRFGAPPFVRAPWRALVRGERLVVRRAVLAGAAATAALAALAIPALSIETGPPDPRFLPSDSVARADFEAIQHAMGPGWPTPFNVVVVSENGPITSARVLRQLERFQARLARDPRVDAVTGPGQLRAQTKDLGSLEGQLDESSKLLGGADKDLRKLQSGLGQAGTGAVQMQDALREAAAGAGMLQGGGGDAQEGARQLEDGLGAARAGSQKIADGLDSALGGATSLQSGAGQALAGANAISTGLGQAAAPVKEGLPIVQQMAADVGSAAASSKDAATQAQTLPGQLDAAAATLDAMTSGRDDPRYAQLAADIGQARQAAATLGSSVAAVDQKLGPAAAVSTAFAAQVAELSKGLDQLYAGSSDLSGGIARLRSGNAALADGIEQLAGGSSDLTGGLGKLRDGAGQLEAGLGVLSGGAGQLAGGLSGGVPKVGQLASGLGTMGSGVARFRRKLPSTEDLERLQAQSPGLFDSGYFVLSAIDGAPAAARDQAAFVVNLGSGGEAGQIAVIPSAASSSASTRALAADLRRQADTLTARTHTTVLVGGQAGELADFQDEIGADIPLVVATVALAVALVLALALRSVPLALVTVAFNLLATAAVFGLLTLLTTGDDPLLGGPGYIDPLQAIETFAAVFGVALVFETMLLQRARELHERGVESHAALLRALTDTAAPATAAAVVIVAAVIPFVASGLFNLRLTVAFAIAVVLDALVVRPVLLPAAVALLGDRAWWPGSRPPATAAKAVRRHRSRFFRRRPIPSGHGE